MRHIILLVTIATIFSCGQNETKQKELELKEREIALKEKELALKQKDTVNTQKTPSTTIQTTEVKADAHSDFKIFWVDFKKAVNNGDKEAIANMTNIPFKDQMALLNWNSGGRLNANSIKQFIDNYDKLFTPDVLKAINSNKYRGWRSADPNADPNFDSEDIIKKGEYVLEVFSNDITALVFSKRKGLYKLVYIPYYS